MDRSKSPLLIWLFSTVGLSIIFWTYSEISSGPQPPSQEFHWPIQPFDSPYPLSKTYGDWNGPVYVTDSTMSVGFHDGIDIPEMQGTLLK